MAATGFICLGAQAVRGAIHDAIVGIYDPQCHIPVDLSGLDRQGIAIFAISRATVVAISLVLAMVPPSDALGDQTQCAHNIIDAVGSPIDTAKVGLTWHE